MFVHDRSMVLLDIVLYFIATLGVPPTSGKSGWRLYITVDDVDARVAKALSAGAKVVRDPATVPGVGRMAAIADPFGAQIALIDYSKA